MSALETALQFLGAGGGLSGIGAIVKTAFDRSDLKKKIEKVETETLPVFERKVAEAMAKFPDLERRALDAVLKVEAAARDAVNRIEAAAARAARASRAGTGADSAQVGAAMATMEAQRREIEALKRDVDALKQVSPVTVSRVSALEDQFKRFDEAYREDYSELLAQVSGVAGEFKQAMRKNNAARPSTDSR